jgi:hypothetical protein
MRVIWDVGKAAANIRNHGIVEKSLCSMRYALCGYLHGRRVYEEKE